MEATIRQAQKPEVGEFFYKAFPPDAIRPAMLEWERVQACDEMYVAEIEGRIVGAVTLATNWRVPTLATLYVSQDCQRSGIGTQLCTDAIRRFVELGKTPVYVDATTNGMKSLILKLPEDLQSHLQVEFSVDVAGDEWEPFEPNSELRRLLSVEAHADGDAQPDREVSKMVYFIDLLEEGQDVAAYQRNLERFSELTGEASLFLWRNIEGTLPASYAESKHYPAVVMLLTRHVCEHIDGVAVLARQGAAEPCKLCLRSALEAAICIQYILEADSEQRGLSYIVAEAHRKITLYDMADQAKRTPFDSYIAGLKSMLTKPEYAPIEADWQARKGKANWYSLFKGPPNFKDMCDRLGQADLYDWTYKNWSSAMHATDGFDKIAGSSKTTGEKSIKPLRHPDGLQSYVVFAITISHMVSRWVLDRWGTQEQKEKAQADYEAKLRPQFKELQGEPVIKAAWH